jgi:hypothetical protein
MLKHSLPVLALLALTLPAAAQERQWALDTSDQDAFLVFGVPESDDVGLSIWCTIYSGKSKIFVPEADGRLKPGNHATMHLTAGKLSLKLEGVVTDNQNNGTRSLEADLPTSSPLYAALQTADRLRITIAGVEQVYPLADADVEGLLKLCNAP